MDAEDSVEHEVYSNCCGSKVINGDICSECGEHCEVGDYQDSEYPEDQVNDLEFEEPTF